MKNSVIFNSQQMIQEIIKRTPYSTHQISGFSIAKFKLTQQEATCLTTGQNSVRVFQIAPTVSARYQVGTKSIEILTRNNPSQNN